MIAGHVDDFLVAGCPDDKNWQAIEEALKQKYKWGEWETDRFTQCGVLIKKRLICFVATALCGWGQRNQPQCDQEKGTQ